MVLLFSSILAWVHAFLENSQYSAELGRTMALETAFNNNHVNILEWQQQKAPLTTVFCTYIVYTYANACMYL